MRHNCVGLHIWGQVSALEAFRLGHQKPCGQLGAEAVKTGYGCPGAAQGPADTAAAASISVVWGACSRGCGGGGCWEEGTTAGATWRSRRGAVVAVAAATTVAEGSDAIGGTAVACSGSASRSMTNTAPIAANTIRGIILPLWSRTCCCCGVGKGKEPRALCKQVSEALQLYTLATTFRKKTRKHERF